MILTHLVAGLVGSYAAISYAEWYIHKTQMHRPGWLRWFSPETFPTHQRLHHPAYQRDFESALPADLAGVGTEISLRFSLKLLVLPLGVLSVFLPVEAACFLVMTVLHGLLWNAVHGEMHEPKGRWFARTRWYAYLRDYHRDHHRNWGTNFNVIAIGADHVFGTLYRGRGGKADGNHPIPDVEGLDTTRG